MKFNVEIEREDDGRWIAQVVDLPGAMAYGHTRDEAVARAEALALRILADRLDNGESLPTLENVFSVPAA
jgi:predicted RNase H-like HicB family nuclease